MSLRFAKLEEIAEVNWGNTSITKASYTPTGYPAFSASGCDGFLPDFEFETPGVVLSAIGAKCGKCFSASGRWTAIKNTITITPHKSIQADLRFLFYYLNRDAIWPKRGGGQPFIGLGDARKLMVPFPPLIEQRRIGAILDRADELRTKRRKALAQLDYLTQSLFLDLFGDPVANPKGWSSDELGALSQKITDGEHLNPVFSQTGMPIVMAGDVREEGVELEKTKIVEWELGNKFRRKCNPEAGDLLLVSRGATIGRQCVVTDERLFCLMGSVILIKPHHNLIDPLFLSVLLRFPSLKSTLYKTSGSSAQQAIYLKDLKSMSCVVPPISMQRKFAKRVNVVERVKVIQRESLAQMDALFVSFHHRAFRGEL